MVANQILGVYTPSMSAPLNRGMTSPEKNNKKHILDTFWTYGMYAGPSFHQIHLVPELHLK